MSFSRCNGWRWGISLGLHSGLALLLFITQQATPRGGGTPHGLTIRFLEPGVVEASEADDAAGSDPGAGVLELRPAFGPADVNRTPDADSRLPVRTPTTLAAVTEQVPAEVVPPDNPMSPVRSAEPDRTIEESPSVPPSMDRPFAATEEVTEEPGNLGATAKNAGRFGGQGAREGAGGPGGGTQFFGVRVPATSVVYVIDVSASMSVHNAYLRARKELLRSLLGLPVTAKFQVIFYNNELHSPPSRNEGTGLLRNSPQQRRIVEQYSQSILPEGGTRHLAALTRALSWNPQTVFLLTDAGDPRLSGADLERLRILNRKRIPIQVIEVGTGPQLVRDNYLSRLAQQHGGSHVYIRLDEPAPIPEEAFDNRQASP